MTVAEALEVLNTAGMIDEIRPSMGRGYPAIGLQVENDGEKSVYIIVLSHRHW